VVVGSKTTDEVGCLNTLINSLNEVISVTLARSSTNTSTDKKSLNAQVDTPQKSSNPPRTLSIC
jgi:hypothetical protein